jgi:hypothetical protein
MRLLTITRYHVNVGRSEVLMSDSLYFEWKV